MYSSCTNLCRSGWSIPNREQYHTKNARICKIFYEISSKKIKFMKQYFITSVSWRCDLAIFKIRLNFLFCSNCFRRQSIVKYPQLICLFGNTTEITFECIVVREKFICTEAKTWRNMPWQVNEAKRRGQSGHQCECECELELK